MQRLALAGFSAAAIAGVLERGSGSRERVLGRSSATTTLEAEDFSTVHLTYYRPAEVLLLLKPRNPEALLSPVDHGEIANFVQARVGMEQHRDPSVGPRGEAAAPIQIRRNGSFLMQKVNLAGWTDRVVNPPQLRGQHGQLVADVATAVRRINQQMSPNDLQLENYDVVAASPNWLTLSANGGGGSPAGRPQPAVGGLMRFDPLEARKEVELGLRAMAQVSGESGTPIKNRHGQGIKVAIFDAFPISDAGDWVQPIRDRRAVVHKAGHDTGHLDRLLAAARRIEFHDCVAGTPLEKMYSQRRNWDDEWEDPYPVADHGLFIASIIHGIAPAADLSFYRVLNDYGGGEFHVLAQAVERAIKDSGDKNLVLNLSLCMGPELLMLSDFLDGDTAQSVYDDKLGWAKRIGEGLREGHDTGHETEALRDKSLWAATELFNVSALGNVFAVAAAGNDSRRPDVVAAPRYPAALRQVLGIAALNAGGDIASYSNDAKLEPSSNSGLLAFGGEVETAGHRAVSREGLVGAYVTGGAADPNDRGYAMWSGTSFATPIAAGLAASIWSEVPGIPGVAERVDGQHVAQPDLMTAMVRPDDPVNRNVIRLSQSG